MNEKVSIIIPVYKVQDYLNQCILSVIEQTYDNFEVILVDDGSPDRCPSICDEWANEDRRVRVIHQRNSGLSSARNTGLKVAIGQYIQFVDSDDVVDRNMLEVLVSSISENHADVAVFMFDYMNEAGTKFTTNPDDSFFPKRHATSGKDALKFLVDGVLSNYSWRYLVKRTIYSQYSITFPEGKHFEDVFTTYKILTSAVRVAYVPKVLLHYRQRQNSILHGKNLVLAYQDAEEALIQRNSDVEKRFPEFAIACRVSVFSWFIHLSWENHYKREFSLVPVEYGQFIDNAVRKYSSFDLIFRLPRNVLIQYLTLKTGFAGAFRFVSVRTGIRYKMNDFSAA